MRWLVNQIQEASLNVLHGVYATVYAPYWYRLLGARVGRDAEISTAQGLIPDLLTLGDETFIADAVLLGDEDVDGGWMELKPTTVARRSFVGNGAYVPDGTSIPENVLIGVHSRVPENAAMQPGDTWLGSPAINLPRGTGFRLPGSPHLPPLAAAPAEPRPGRSHSHRHAPRLCHRRRLHHRPRPHALRRCRPVGHRGWNLNLAGVWLWHRHFPVVSSR